MQAAHSEPLQYNEWFVSPLATGTVHDGKSWKTAWTDFNKIDWTKVQKNDLITLDAGPTASSVVYYRSPLVVQKDDVSFMTGLDAGHNAGSLVLQGKGPSAINVGNHNNVYILGSKWLPNALTTKSPHIYIDGTNYTNGLTVGPNAGYVSVMNVRIARCQKGIDMQGGHLSLSQAMVNDNKVNISCSPASSALCIVNQSWICNTLGTPTPGVSTTGTGEGRMIINDCVLGPGLSKAIDLNSPTVRLQATESLFLNPSITNLNVVQAPQDVVPYSVKLWKCTSFLLPLNQLGQAHSCLTFKQPSQYGIYNVGASIFQGGTVSIEGTSLIGYLNVQFKTTGNVPVVGTTADPKFTNPTIANSYPTYDALFKALCKLDLSLQYNSPARNQPYGAAGNVDAGASTQNSSVSRFLDNIFSF